MGDSTEKTAKTSFFGGIKSEFKKITWPDRKDLLKQSVAVVSISVVVGAIIAVLAFLVQHGVRIVTTF